MSWFSRVANAFRGERVDRELDDELRFHFEARVGPFHTHDELQKLQPGETVRLEVEVWPTSVVLERGERLVLEVGAKDDPQSFFQHDDPHDRARTGTNTIHTGGAFDSHLLLPIIPG